MFPPHGAPGVAVVWWQLSGLHLFQVAVARIPLLHQQQTHADKLGMINQ